MSSLPVTRAEIWWVMKMLMSHSFHFCLDLNKLLKTMFPDSQISKSFRLSKTKCYYDLVHQLAPYFKLGLSPSKKICVVWKPFKNDEKCFSFQLKSSFRSQDVWVFVTTFCPFRKNGWIREIRLTSKFMMSQPGLQTIAIHISRNCSRHHLISWFKVFL